MQACPESISVGDTKYIREDLIPDKPTGNRAVVVVDRGWIFAGDVTEGDGTGNITLTRAVHVSKWTQIGFDGMVKDPKSLNVTLRPLKHSVQIPEGSEIFRIPVPNDWGL